MGIPTGTPTPKHTGASQATYYCSKDRRSPGAPSFKAPSPSSARRQSGRQWHTARATAFSFEAFWGRSAYYRTRLPGSVTTVVLSRWAASQFSTGERSTWTRS
ncbi:unnamed protein product [Choristocarpus tenellus]